MMVLWTGAAVAVVAAGAAVQDRWPHSITARIVAMMGGAWFAGVWLSAFLLGLTDLVALH